MRLTIVRSGGFAGGEPEEVARLDTSQLDADRARQTEEAVRELQQRPPEIGADLIRYQITVGDEKGQSTVIATDDGDPKNPLYKLLETVS